MNEKTPTHSAVVQHLCLSLLVSGCFLAPTAWAAETLPSELKKLTIVEATRSHVTLDETPKAITVIDRQQIEAAVTTGGIQQLVAEIPGVDFARTGGLGGQLVIRGFGSNTKRALLTVDGERVRGRSTLEYNIYDPAMIERIEVIRGPASSVHGADAMNGVVNIITRRAKVDHKQPFALEGKVRSVEYNSVNKSMGGRAEIIGGGDGFDILAGVNMRKGDDFETPLGTAENSAFKAKSFDLKAGYKPTDTTRWEVNARISETTTERAGGYGASPGAPFKTVEEDPIDEQYVKVSYEDTAFSTWADRFFASAYVRKFDTDIFVNGGKVHLRVDTPTVIGGRVVFNKTAGDHLFTWGGDVFSEEFGGRYAVLPTGATKQLDRESETFDAGVYFIDDWYINDKTQLSTAVRWDHIKTSVQSTPIPGEDPVLTAVFDKASDETENALTGSLGLVRNLNDDWSVVASYSRAFHAADGLTRTIASTAGTIPTLPNPQLESETSDTFEMGVRFNDGLLSSSLVAYQSEYADLIALQKNGDQNDLSYKRVNIGEATIKGLEWEMAWQMNAQWQLRSALTYTHGQDDTNGHPLAGIPPLNGFVAARYTADSDAWWAEAKLRGSERRDRIDEAKERERPGYGAVDVKANIDLGKTMGYKNWQLTLGVDNVFDKEIRNPVVEENLKFSNDLIGNPMVEPGRNIAIKLVNNY